MRSVRTWLLGIVEDVIIGSDGRVRAVRVKSRRGVTTRPNTKLGGSTGALTQTDVDVMYHFHRLCVSVIFRIILTVVSDI